MENTTDKFENWAIVEIMGHIKCAGLAQTVTFGNTVMLRVDIPETSKQPAHTKMYGMSSIFSISPVTEDVARSHAEAWNIQPIIAYEVQNAYQKRFDEAVEKAVERKMNPQLESRYLEDDGFPDFDDYERP
ncbi:hypothetical protein I2I11_04115 [Pontibacter sp. 172403-2]|uniref:hypothetical protein n=1 Tax=Pontibacter rufus TaxID=2791028 RepID=UPI0018AF9E9C|nr:hypothetical protein [Pontibacter sp. 172403-2]MBF9252469.1 hypothetical protein [Pontibacter sp. 172403-2]